MIPIKIQCACGQKYSFEAEPIDGRMASTIACPICGVDGTEAANEAIAMSLPPSPPPAPAAVPSPALRINTAAPSAPAVSPSPGVRINTPAPAVSATTRNAAGSVPKINLEQARHEARAKIIWGDSTNSVISFLMVNGFKREEATAFVQAFYKERLAAVRAKAVKTLFLGILCLAVPGGTWLYFWHLGVTSSTLIVITSAIGVGGLYLTVTGFLKLMSSKSEQGDAAQ